MTCRIPVSAPQLGTPEYENVLAALQAGEISGSAGTFIERLEREFAAYCGVNHAIAVSSGSTALHLAMVLAGIGPDDEVLVPAATNIATAAAVVQCGGIVVPIDCEPDTWCMDPALLEAAITPRTKVIVPVHLYGHPVDMAEVWLVAQRHNLLIIEDAAEAHGATYRGVKAGALGHLACFSFYANKVITTGEGGMLTTNSDAYAQRARLLRNLAFTEPRFWHEELGFNYRMTNVQAAIGCGQLERIESIVEAKRDLARRYTERLSGIRGLRLPIERSWARNVYWMYALVVEPEFGTGRDELMAALVGVGIETRTMFCPMHLQPALLSRGAVRRVRCPVAEELWERGLYLPSTPSLTDQDLDRICDAIGAARWS
jgi:perosamine synthetase